MQRKGRVANAAAAALTAVLALPACGEAGVSEGAGEADAGETAPWGRVLSRFAHRGGVDYAALAADRTDLDLYLSALASARPQGRPTAERIAFWTNAYNAVVLARVLEHYPGIGSVREVPGFFDRLTWPVAGEELTLDEIETRARDLGDPRVHFAVVCASTSCPPLRAEPFEAPVLDRQLEEQTRRFLADPEHGLRYDAEANELWLSSIFKWYAGDFTGGSTVVAFFARGRLVEWLIPHLPAPLASALTERSPSVRYLDYDWGLNDRPLAGPAPARP